jgi:hypothetical protein
MQTVVYKAIQDWLKANTGLELASLVWTITLLIPAANYGRDSTMWLRDHATSTMRITLWIVEARNIQAWVKGQPVNAVLSWLSASEDLILMRNTQNTSAQTNHSVGKAVKAQNHQFFFYQGTPFILHKTPNDDNRFLILRCLWPSSRHC